MKTYRNYADLPRHAIYLGGEHGDGTIDENVFDAIDDAIAPVKLIEDGLAHYFDVAVEVTK